MAIEILEVWGVRFHHHLSGFSSLNSNESHQGWKSAFLSTVENLQKNCDRLHLLSGFVCRFQSFQ
tara:strand:- start:4201 stop:4395 length:195 start_codon:yes stop_codon:yes gene_type:complete